MRQNILLISLQEDLDTIGIKYLHYSLLENKHNSILLYLPNFDKANVKPIINFIKEKEISLVGISLMSHEYQNACILTKSIKESFDIPIVWGGIHPTISPETCLDYADYACIGEGEKTMLDIANGNNPSKINNLCYKENDKIIRNDLYPYINDLNTIPCYEHLPKNSFIQINGKIVILSKKYFRRYSRYNGTFYSIMGSRGCPFSCAYCCNNALFALYKTRKVRYRDTNDVIGELVRAIVDNPYIEYINFQDDCFLSNSFENLKEFADDYGKFIKKPFIIRSIPIFVTKEKIEILKKAGLRWIGLGLQSGSDNICEKIYHRKSLSQDFLKAATIIKQANLSAFYDVILDNPLESEEDKLKTINVLMNTPKPFAINLFSLVFYEGTELYRMKNNNEFLTKNYHLYNKNEINELIRLSAVINTKSMIRLLYTYKYNKAKFKYIFPLFKIIGSIKEAIIQFKLIKLSQNNSYIKTLRIMPDLIKTRIWQYYLQFTG